MELTTQELKALEAAMKEAFGRMGGEISAVKAALLDIQQRRAAAGVPFGGGASAPSELVNAIMASAGYDSWKKGGTPTFAVEVPNRLIVRNAIVNPAPGTTNPLVPPDRSGGIVFAPQQRLTIRALFRQIPTASNLIERPAEATFSSNAGVQGGDASPVGSGEGSLKNESQMTFTLAQTPVVTIAHYIVASRQILSDAPLLQAHLEGRLLYGLNLEEEQEMLTGTGAAGEMTGINASAAAFTGGVTNATALDTLARALNQLAVGNFEPSGIVLHPTDWLAIKLAKDTTGRYLVGDPATATPAALWGLPVIATPSQTLGRFTCLDALRYGYVADRETATVRISENVSDAFLRNLIHLLCEKRTTLVTELGTAAVYGVISQAG